MGSVKVAIVGVGNCAASLVQGVHYYRDADESASVPGLMHVRFGDYHVSDIEFVAAFDVDAKKVGRDLSEAIVASENNTIKICDVPPLGVTVQRGTTLDGLGKYYRETDRGVRRAAGRRRRRAARVRRRRPRLLPARRLAAGRGVLRPGRDRRRRRVRQRPARSSSPAPRSGRTSSPPPACRSSVTTSRARSAPPSPTACSPSSSRTAACSSTARCSSTSAATWTSRTCSSASAWSPRRSPRPSRSPARSTATWAQGNVHIGPSDHVPWLSDRKWAYVRLEGRAFGDVPLSLEYKLEVWDSPNSAGIIIDAVRAAKIAKDRGIGGPILSASSYFMKSPPVQYATARPATPSRPSSAATSSADSSTRCSRRGPALRDRSAGPRRVVRGLRAGAAAYAARMRSRPRRCCSRWGWRWRWSPAAPADGAEPRAGGPGHRGGGRRPRRPPAPQPPAGRRRLRGHRALRRRRAC